MIDIKDFDYSLPKKLIAQFPAEKRDETRLMILNRRTEKTGHKRFFEITDYLKNGDILVLNDTRVIPARLYGKKNTKGCVEVFLLEGVNKQTWKCLLGNSKGITPKSTLEFEDCLKARIIAKNKDGSWLIEFSAKGDLQEIINKIGVMPLPPYIKRGKGNNPLTPHFSKGGQGGLKELDKERYQTVFAKKNGAVAAPAAGLHFTDELLSKIKSIGVEIQYITLHTGWGTFKPIKVQDATQHKMPEEYYEVEKKVFESIKAAKKQGRRIIAVGSTSLRTLETMVNPPLPPFTKVGGEGGFGWDNPMLKGYTDLFIYPGFRFKVVDAMLTNFHLPKSTLFLLVCAFAGRDMIMSAYKEAIDKNYRFFSYGDAMLIL